MTLNRKINCRQAEETAPQQQFESPQAELEWLKENRQDLKGFVRVLEVIDEAQREARPFFEIQQSDGRLCKNWLDRHSDTCAACAGSLLCWFFGDESEIIYYPDRKTDTWPYESGFRLLDEHLGFHTGGWDYLEDYCDAIQASGAANEIKAIIHRLTGGDEWGPDGCEEAGTGMSWPAPHLDVFRKLAAMHPDK